MGRHLPTLAALEGMCLDELQSAWLIVCDAQAPRLRIDLLRLGLAYRVQEQQFGLVTVWFRSLVYHYATLASKAKGLMPPRCEWRLRAL
jgi:hypothetical protein